MSSHSNSQTGMIEQALLQSTERHALKIISGFAARLKSFLHILEYILRLGRHTLSQIASQTVSQIPHNHTYQVKNPYNFIFSKYFHGKTGWRIPKHIHTCTQIQTDWQTLAQTASLTNSPTDLGLQTQLTVSVTNGFTYPCSYKLKSNVKPAHKHNRWQTHKRTRKLISQTDSSVVIRKYILP